MNAIRDIALLAAKDLRVEVRGRHCLPLLCVLAVLLVTVLGLAAPSGSGLAPGAVLWVACLFGGALCFEKTMAADQRDDALAALLLTPVDRGVIFIARWLVNLLLLSVVAAVVTGAAVLMLRMRVEGSPVAFARVVLLGLAGFAAVGTLFSAVAVSSRLGSGLLAALIFPMCLPIVLVSSRLLGGAGAEGPAGTGESLLVAFDVVFVAVGWLTFELVLES